MCIAIVKPKDKTINKETLQVCAKNNPDGCGFAFNKDGKVYMCKFMDFDSFYKAYSKVESTSAMLIHFRIATHGKVELKNCHPFKLNNRMALIHNGVISGYGDKENITDTQDFINKVIGNISWKMWNNPAFLELVGKAIGFSKFGILDTEGNTYIINKDKGEEVDGVWYSNSSYKPKVYTNYNKYNYNKYSYDGWHLTNPTYIWDDKTREWVKKYPDNNKIPCDKTDGEVAKDNKVSSDKQKDFDDIKIIYKCKSCGNEVALGENDKFISCNKCSRTAADEVGFIYDGQKYYYEDEGFGFKEVKEETKC